MAVVEGLAQGIFVQMLPDENKLLHTVAVLLVPVALKRSVHLKLMTQLILRHRGKPLPYVLQGELTPCLFEKVADIRIVLKPAHALCAYHLLRPMPIDKEIEPIDVEGRTAVVNPRGDAILLCLALIVVMMVVVMVVMFLLLIIVVIIIVMVMIFFIVVMMVVMMVFFFLILFVVLGCRSALLNLLNPCG